MVRIQYPNVGKWHAHRIAVWNETKISDNHEMFVFSIAGLKEFSQSLTSTGHFWAKSIFTHRQVLLFSKRKD